MCSLSSTASDFSGVRCVRVLVLRGPVGGTMVPVAMVGSSLWLVDCPEGAIADPKPST